MPQEEALNIIKSMKATGNSPVAFERRSVLPAPYFNRSLDINSY
jgi:hypothetical protein